MTSSLGGSSLGSPQKDQVMLADALVLAPGALVAAAAGAAAVGAVWVCDGWVLWHAARSPTPARPSTRSSPRRVSCLDVCISCMNCEALNPTLRQVGPKPYASRAVPVPPHQLTARGARAYSGVSVILSLSQHNRISSN